MCVPRSRGFWLLVFNGILCRQLLIPGENRGSQKLFREFFSWFARSTELWWYDFYRSINPQHFLTLGILLYATAANSNFYFLWFRFLSLIVYQRKTLVLNFTPNSSGKRRPISYNSQNYRQQCKDALGLKLTQDTEVAKSRDVGRWIIQTTASTISTFMAKAL